MCFKKEIHEQGLFAHLLLSQAQNANQLLVTCNIQCNYRFWSPCDRGVVTRGKCIESTAQHRTVHLAQMAPASLGVSPTTKEIGICGNKS